MSLKTGLIEIANYARGQIGYRAARAGDWVTASQHLWAACQSGERSRATLTNAALASEALNRFSRAADLWQKVLRYVRIDQAAPMRWQRNR